MKPGWRAIKLEHDLTKTALKFRTILNIAAEEICIWVRCLGKNTEGFPIFLKNSATQISDIV